MSPATSHQRDRPPGACNEVGKATAWKHLGLIDFAEVCDGAGRMRLENAVSETASKILAADTSAALNRVFDDFVTPFGAEFWAAVMLSRGTQIDPALPREFGAPPTLWQKHYREQSYALDDPATLRVMKTHSGFFLSDLAYARDLSARGRTIVGERADWGLGYGVVSPVRLSDGSVWALGCWSARIERAPDLPMALALAGQIYIARAVALASPDGGASATLSARMEEVLKLMRAPRRLT